MAVATSIMGAKGAIEAGQDAYINTTVNGMGERAGNCDLVSTLLALKHGAEWAELDLLDPRVKLDKAWQIAKYAEHCFGVPIPVNQPGTGANMFKALSPFLSFVSPHLFVQAILATVGTVSTRFLQNMLP